LQHLANGSRDRIFLQDPPDQPPLLADVRALPDLAGRPPGCPLFPYTTLFRSRMARSLVDQPALSVAYPKYFRPSVEVLRVRDRRSEEHTSELQSLRHLVCRLLLEKKKAGWL